MRFFRRIEGVLTRCVALRFENSKTSSRYFSELKNLSVDGLAMSAECVRKTPQTSLTSQSK